MNRGHALRITVRYSNGKHGQACEIRRIIEGIDREVRVQLSKFSNGNYRKHIRVNIKYSEGLAMTVQRIFAAIKGIGDESVIVKTSLLKKKRPSLRRPVNVNIYS